MKNLSWTLVAVSVLLLIFTIGVALGGQATPPKKTPELLQTGKKLFEVNCTPCHGPKGDGKGPVGAALKPPPNDFTHPLSQWPKTKGVPQKIFEVISKGIPDTGMVKWDQFSEQERWALVYTVMEFATPSKPAPAKKMK